MEVVADRPRVSGAVATWATWLGRFCDFLAAAGASAGRDPRARVEAYLRAIAIEGASPAAVRQARDALACWYREGLGQPIAAIDLPALDPAGPAAPDLPAAEIRAVLGALHDLPDPDVRLIAELMAGCGLRPGEGCGIRTQDVDLRMSRLTVRAASGARLRVVPLPSNLISPIEEQLAAAWAVWDQDQLNRIPAQLPRGVAKKFPRLGFDWAWAWLTPAPNPARDPWTGEPVRWRCPEAAVQQAVRAAAIAAGFPRVNAETLRAAA